MTLDGLYCKITAERKIMKNPECPKRQKAVSKASQRNTVHDKGQATTLPSRLREKQSSVTVHF